MTHVFTQRAVCDRCGSTKQAVLDNVAPECKVVADAADGPGDVMWTYVSIRGEGAFPFTETGHVLHRRDLSDLQEPYLSAVIAAREARA